MSAFGPNPTYKPKCGRHVSIALKVDDPDYQRALKAVEDAYEDREAVQCRRELHILETHLTDECHQVMCKWHQSNTSSLIDDASKFLTH